MWGVDDQWKDDREAGQVMCASSVRTMSGVMSRMMMQRSESNDARDAAWIGSYRLAIMGEAAAFEEDANIRSHLAVLGPAALAELRRIPEAPNRTPLFRALTARPTAAGLATVIAMADTDEVVRLRLLRAIRDLGV